MIQVNQFCNNNPVIIELILYINHEADVLKKLFNLKYIFEINIKKKIIKDKLYKIIKNYKNYNKKKIIFEIFECSLLCT